MQWVSPLCFKGLGNTINRATPIIFEARVLRKNNLSLEGSKLGTLIGIMLDGEVNEDCEGVKAPVERAKRSQRIKTLRLGGLLARRMNLKEKSRVVPLLFFGP